MEPGGDNSSSSSTSHHSSSSSNVNDYYYASFARVAAGGGQAEGSALLGWAAATHAAEAGSADPGWRKAFGDSGPPRGLHRRVVTAFAPCTYPHSRCWGWGGCSLLGGGEGGRPPSKPAAPACPVSWEKASLSTVGLTSE